MNIKLNIVEKANTLFRTYGFRGVTVDDICKECGISKKTIYNYYSDKQSLANETIKYHYNNLHKEIKAIIDLSDNSIETFFKISSHFRETLNDTTPLFVHDLKKFHPDLYNNHQDYKENLFEKSLQKVLIKGKNEGFIRDDINDTIVSKLRIEMIEIGFNQDVFPLKKYNYRDIQLISFDLFLRGIVTTDGLNVYEKILKKIN
ncbi:MAG: hypothetical protein CMB87_04190 [Flammeovirgaceae bacterium]|nr:hypothetical protein [Flammeovirgaceae bacterium]|tara:strand:+ start:74 stop:682 length:609 start_codon:yes stop_codon:yes gene_type:complete